MFDDVAHFKGNLLLGSQPHANRNCTAEGNGTSLTLKMPTSNTVQIPQVELTLTINEALKLAALIVAQAAANQP